MTTTPPLTAAELLEGLRNNNRPGQGNGGVDPLSQWLLEHLLSPLDDMGAWSWNLYHVGLVTFFALAFVRVTLKHWRGVDWYALWHALVSAGGAACCLYLDYRASEALTGLPEPLRSVQCHPPLTSLHRILPAITMGYAIFDVVDGITISLDFLFHGTITLIVMSVFVIWNAPQMVAPFLFMELSTPFLNLVRADFFHPRLVAVNQACFVLSFFLSRLVVVPPFWAALVYEMWRNRENPEYTQCFPRWFLPFSFVFGLFFHILNVYWFRKILRKAWRRVKGMEGITERNELSSEADRHKKE